MTGAELNNLATKVLDCAFVVHRELGPGLLESTYVACLVHELRLQGVEVATEVPCPVVYKGTKLTDVGYRIDILVAHELVVEVKAVAAILPVHRAQLLSYLRHTKLRLGLLLNFHAILLRDGIVRQVNQL